MNSTVDAPCSSTAINAKCVSLIGQIACEEYGCNWNFSENTNVLSKPRKVDIIETGSFSGKDSRIYSKKIILTLDRLNR